MNWKVTDDTDILQKLQRPEGKVRVVIDTDAYNEIDDQYALAYALKKTERLQVEAIYAAPFLNETVESVREGMEKSYREILRMLPMLDREDMADKVFKGSEEYLPDENTPCISDAARDLVDRAMALPEGETLYVAALGAITNVASALLMEPKIARRIVVVWLGGHGYHWRHTREFNLRQDVAAVRVVFNSRVPLVHIPCMGVASHLLITEPEIREHLKGKSAVGDYLYEITCNIAARKNTKYWSRVIWDVSVFMWLAGPQNAMVEQIVQSPTINYDCTYSFHTSGHRIKLITEVKRDMIFEEYFETVKDR
jgi:inosine-uridine nucleoside N-ribohydrolase